MPQQFAEFIGGQQRTGLLVVPQHLTVREVADELILIWTVTEVEEWLNRICYLPL
jgi:hypothetical protein